MVQPDYKEFSRLSRDATLIPVVKSVSADLLTPVSAFLAIADKEPYAFLLESVERGEQIGRYTFLGVRPYMRVRAREGTVEIERGRRREEHPGNIFQVAKELLREHRPANVPGLPPFTAGGFLIPALRFAYATRVTWSEAWAVVIELGAYLVIWPTIGLRRAALVSFCANGASFFIGLMLRWA